jgi:hypothetical protein
MKKLLQSCFLVTCAVIIFTSCGTTGNGILFTERSISPADVEFQRVAILPNRLPLNLQDPEMWRTNNFNVMKKRFEREGFQVIDYNTSVEMFNKSGLPMEDTKVSRDKYAELASEMGADILIFPYYGTSFRVTGFTDKQNFEVVGSLQIYLANQNDFMTRIDFTGKNYYSAFTKIIPLFSGLTMILSGVLAAESPEVVIVFAVLSPAISIATLIPALKPPRKRYMKAFSYSINKGLDQFFIKYKGRKIVPKNQKPAQVVSPATDITKVEQKVEPKVEPKAVVKVEPTIEAKTAPKTEAIKTDKPAATGTTTPAKE